jgi:hypothetical protein
MYLFSMLDGAPAPGKQADRKNDKKVFLPKKFLQ